MRDVGISWVILGLIILVVIGMHSCFADDADESKLVSDESFDNAEDAAILPEYEIVSVNVLPSQGQVRAGEGLHPSIVIKNKGGDSFDTKTTVKAYFGNIGLLPVNATIDLPSAGEERKYPLVFVIPAEATAHGNKLTLSIDIDDNVISKSSDKTIIVNAAAPPVGGCGCGK